jgi:hypothetical protein
LAGDTTSFLSSSSSSFLFLRIKFSCGLILPSIHLMRAFYPHVLTRTPHAVAASCWREHRTPRASLAATRDMRARRQTTLCALERAPKRAGHDLKSECARREREDEDEEEDKKVVVPPVNHNPHPAADSANVRHHARAQGRRKALWLHATYRAQNSVCVHCSPSPCPLGAWEIAIEPRLGRSIAVSTQAAAMVAVEGQLTRPSSPEWALWQRGGGGTSPSPRR